MIPVCGTISCMMTKINLFLLTRVTEYWTWSACKFQVKKVNCVFTIHKDLLYTHKANGAVQMLSPFLLLIRFLRKYNISSEKKNMTASEKLVSQPWN